MSEEYNPRRARAKRPCPLWVDAFQRDTQHLAADEVGAYMLILMAMWTRETCDFPDDDRRLAAVCRVSIRLWKARIGPAIREFLTVENGALISDRLRKEAAYTERQCKAQSDRKKAEKSDNALKSNDAASTTDKTTDTPVDASPDQPTQLPNYPTIYSDTNVSGADAPKPVEVSFLSKAVWEAGKAYLTSRGVKNPGSLIGKWLKGSTPVKLLEAIEAAQRSGTQDPVPYITEALKPRSGQPDLDEIFNRMGGQ